MVLFRGYKVLDTKIKFLLLLLLLLLVLVLLLIRTVSRRSRLQHPLCRGLVGDVKEPTSLFEKSRGFSR